MRTALALVAIGAYMRSFRAMPEGKVPPAEWISRENARAYFQSPLSVVAMKSGSF
jgi:hypothetical protein